jgi:hypothetical protein
MVFSTSCKDEAEARAFPRPAIYNMERLDELKSEYQGNNTSRWNSFINEAEAAIVATPVSVLDKHKTFFRDKHTYCSISRYAWPSEKDSSIYIIKDGVSNPEFNDFDLPKLELLRDRLKTLSVAYYVTHDRRYLDAFTNHLKTWFLNKDTYMKPNMEFAQVQPGANGNKGMSYGLVELERFTPIIESICLVHTVTGLDRQTRKGIKKWFKEMLSWTLNSEQWAVESRGTNNIVAGLYVTLVEMARFTGDRKTIRRLGEEYKERILDVQIDEEGKQPAELKRTIGYGYSVGNLNNIVDFCLIMENAGVHFYEENQNVIDKAFGYLFQFEGNRSAFPYQQKAGWDHYERMLHRNATRLTRMKTRTPNRRVLSKEVESEKESIIEYVY